MERSWSSVCTINLPEYDDHLIIQNGNFESRAWLIANRRLRTSLWLCGYRSVRDKAPFIIGLIDHARCRLEDSGRWILVGKVLAHQAPCLNLPGLCTPFPRACRNPCPAGPCLDDAALVLYGFPSVAQTITQLQTIAQIPTTTQVPTTAQMPTTAQVPTAQLLRPACSRPLRDFSFSEVADELRRRMELSRERHLAWYGAVLLDKTNANCLQSLHALSQHLCTREITFIFTQSFVRHYRCANQGCSNAAAERCHGQTNSRPVMFQRAWFLVEPLHGRFVPLLQVIREFLLMHLAPEAEFSFMCHACHRDADRSRGGFSESTPVAATSSSGASASTIVPCPEQIYPCRECLALDNYEHFYSMTRGSVTRNAVQNSSAGLQGWADVSEGRPSGSGARGSNDLPSLDVDMNNVMETRQTEIVRDVFDEMNS